MKKSRMMAVLDPVKVVIDNYPEGQTEYLDVVNNLENEALGVPRSFSVFERTLYRTRRLWRRSHRKVFPHYVPGQ